MSLKSEIRQAIVERLQQRGIGQARFARCIGIGAGAINQLLKGKGRKPTTATVRALDAYFEKGGEWVTAFCLDCPPRKQQRFSLASAKFYSLAEYARKKEQT